MTDAVVSPAGASGKTFLGHPRGLFVLFLTEMWERFSYYGMRALLIFYLTQHFLFSDQRSAVIYGAYTALVYVMPVIGGTLADRYLGSRKAVTFGAILLVLGHFGMAFEGEQSQQFVEYQGASYEIVSEGFGANQTRFIEQDGVHYPMEITPEGIVVAVQGDASVPRIFPTGEFDLRTVKNQFFLNIFYLSLALIISGVGFLKANISTIVGSLYEPGDRRRDSGFTIFYMGINLGSFLSTLIVGYLGQTFGWKYGFGLAGVGMLLGLLVFQLGQPLLEGRADPPDAEKLKQRSPIGLSMEWTIYLGGLLMVAVSWLLIKNEAVVGTLLQGFGLVVLLFIVGYAIFSCPKVDRERMLVATFLIMLQLPFWALFEQAGSSLNLMTERLVNRELFGYEIPASMFQSLNAGFIFTLAPLFAWLWVYLSKRKMEPNTPLKFALGILQVGLGFLILVQGIKLSGPDGLVPMIWIVLLYLVHTTGELCLSPVGLSMVTKLSVARMVGTMMGAWFLASGFANYLAGVIAASTGAETIGGQIVDVAAAKTNYIDVYTQVAWIAIAIAAGVAILSPLLKKGMHGVH